MWRAEITKKDQNQFNDWDDMTSDPRVPLITQKADATPAKHTEDPRSDAPRSNDPRRSDASTEHQQNQSKSLSLAKYNSLRASY